MGTLKNVAAPLVLNATVPEARSAPVGRLPVALLIATTRFGGVPLQPEQNRSTPTLIALPVTLGVKVWPNHAVLLKAAPLVVRVVFCWSTGDGLDSVTSPGLVFRSKLVATPVKKSDCVVSVRQAESGASVNEKFCVVVLPSVTTIDDAEADTNPALLASIDGYVPAGILVNE